MEKADAARFLRFLAAGGLAAAANFGSRIVFSLAMPLEAAVLCAFAVGLAVGFLLMRSAVFPPSDQPLGRQVALYCAVNALAALQTLVITVLLARYLLPAWHVQWHVEEIAHAVGIAVPIATSYVGHKRLTFRRAAGS